MRRALSILVAAALLVSIGATGYWAGTNAVVPPEFPVAEHPVQSYVATTGTVGRTVRLPVTASWSTTHTIYAAVDGVVTSVGHRSGSLAAAGQVVATIDLEPVVVSEGPVPMFRTLRKGVRGPDVAQLQRLLIAQGFLNGPADGRFEVATVEAAKRWQRSVAARVTGEVSPGSLLFVEGLPQRLEILPAVGQRISAGGEFVHVLGATPGFAATASQTTRAELTTGMSVEIVAPGGGTWTGQLGRFVPTDDGRYAVSIEGPLCGDGCDAIAVGGETTLSGSVVLVPEIEGVVVPTSALLQEPSGGAAVTLTDGSVREVRIVAEADGFAVVEGLERGTTIRLPALSSP